MERPLLALRGADVITGDGTRRADVLLASGTIVAIGETRDLPARLLRTMDLRGCTLIPGLVDAHAHVMGGGGGDGFETRAPELQLTDLSTNAITTVVGAPGIDMASRSMETLLAKAQALEIEGLTAFVYAGGFQRPLASVTGSAWRDCYVLPRVIGVKIAVGERRAASYTAREIVDLARELAWVRRATRRAAVLHVHLGREPEGRALLRETLPLLPEPAGVVVTHCNFSTENLAAAPEFARLGARVDVSSALAPERGTASAIPPADAVEALLDAGVAPGLISLSTDGNGEVPVRVGDGWDAYRTHMDSLLAAVREIASRRGLEVAVAVASASPASALGLAGTKGGISVGGDGDLVALDRDLRVRHVFARGRALVSDGEPAVTGRYETPATSPSAPLPSRPRRSPAATGGRGTATRPSRRAR